MQYSESSNSRISHVERQPRFLKFAVFGLLLLIVMAIVTILRTSSVRAADGAIIRTRGIVIEDTKGRPRLLIGAPIPRVEGRRYRDELTNGIVLLEETGTDRLVVGDALQPQIVGKVGVRKGTEGASGFGLMTWMVTNEAPISLVEMMLC
jgi:hypothetical protein